MKPTSLPQDNPTPRPPARRASSGAALVATALTCLAAVAGVAAVWPSAVDAADPGVRAAAAAVVAATGAAADGLAAHRSGISVAEAERADQRAQLCSGANAVGVGLRGEYFASPGFGGERLLARTDATLDFDAALDWPADQARRPRSARWAGWVKAPLTGRYRFHAEPAGVVVEVAGQRLTGPQSPPEAGVELAAGRFYPVVVEWPRMARDDGALRLQWTAPHGARFTIPRNSLFLPTETVTTASR